MEDELTPSVPGISVSAASDDEEHEEEFSLIDNLPSRKDSKSSESSSSSSSDSEKESNEASPELVDENRQDQDAGKDNSLAEDTENLSINENVDSQETNEAVGDRILIEKDGKFELVDVSEVKAEYFQMMGLNDTSNSTSLEEKPATDNTDKSSKEDSVNSKSPRPKTSPIKTSPKHSKRDNRAISAQISGGKRNDEYAHIKSRYAMTEHQLEMKKRKEEAIARRKKEEEERQRLEMERKRDDAERAFQVTCCRFFVEWHCFLYLYSLLGNACCECNA